MEELSHAQKDFLTGFYTREHLISTLLKRIIDANLHRDKFSILLVDIDHFKRINDKYGHLWGDEFLKFVSSTLRLTLENKGVIFRYGGDEFVVLFSTSDPKEAYALAKQFNLIVRNRPFLFNGHLFKITISCGLATYPDDAQGAEGLIREADKALYFSKKYGRNTTTQVNKMAFKKFKMVSVLFSEILVIIAVVLFVNTFVFKGILQRLLKRLPINITFSLGNSAQTKITLKSGEVLYGQIIREDENELILNVMLGQGSAVMSIEKELIAEIANGRNK